MYVESTKNKLSWDFAQEFKLVWFSFYSLFSIPCSSHKIFGRPTCLTKQEILNLKLRQIKRITSKLKENWNSYQPQQLTITPAVSFSTFNLLGGMINVSIKLKSEIKGLERHSVYQAKSRKLIMFEKTHENWMLYSQKRKSYRNSFGSLQLLQKSLFTHGLERSWEKFLFYGQNRLFHLT